jgi:hypothetical protein
MPHKDAHHVTRALFITAAAIFFAALCWMSGVDRMTASSTRFQKAFFGGDAAAQLAFEDLAQKNPQVALGEAQRAVGTAPVDPSTTSALGSSLLALGRAGQAYTAFSVAGSLGWRDIPTQLYWLTQAVAVGAVDVVKQRLDALLRLQINNDAVASSLDLLERTRPGQIALATLLSEDPPWKSQFLVGTGNLEGDDFGGRVAAIDLATANGATLDCAAIGTAANHLIVNGRVMEAKDLWRRGCDRTGDLYVSDGSFEVDPAKASSSPFDWRLQARGGLDSEIAAGPSPLKGNALRIASSETVRTIAARELAALRPGRYALSWTTALDNGKPDDSISVLIQCNGLEALDVANVAAPSGSPNQVRETFAVPAQGCPIQAIDVQKAASASGAVQTGWIDDIGIAPLDPGAADTSATGRK